MSKRAAKPTSIKRRLTIGFLMIAFIMSLICLLTFISNIFVSRRYVSIYENSTLISSINAEVKELQSATERYLSTKTTDSLERAHECMNSLGLMTYDLKKLAPDSRVNMMMIDIAEMTDTLMSHVNAALLAKISRNGEAYTNEFEKIRRLTGYIDTHSMNLNALLIEENSFELYEQTVRQNRINLVIIGAFVLVIGVCALYIAYQSNVISKPIIQIAESAYQISRGNFSIPDITADTNDEIDKMAVAFNAMKVDIRSSIEQMEKQRLLERILKEEQMDNLRINALLKDAEFVALQSQIQPHFLFNTINAGMQIAYRENADETVEFLSNMSGLLRYNLKNMRERVSLTDEMEQTQRYLYLLEKRFSESVSFSVSSSIAPDIQKNIFMPPMILQPLVENSYAHGIRGMANGGTIRVAAKEKDGRYAVEITDNGAGMDAEDIARLLKGEKINEGADKTKSTGIGIHNVKNRLELYFERPDVLDIESEKGKGTTVTVFLEEVK